MLLIKGGGIGTCFETKKGESLWGPKRIQNAGDYFASPVYGDGKIYIAGENGNVVVLENGPDLKILAKNNLGESVLGTPAIADGRLFFRTRSSLICVSK
jgi:outer membrane protein assembly factor BamB